MKTTIMTAGIALLLLAGSCKKDDKKPVSTFTVNGTEYKATTVAGYPTGAVGQLLAHDNTLEWVMDCSFAVWPTTDGTFTVVNKGIPSGSNEMVVSVYSGIDGEHDYLSTGNDGVKASVTVSGGMISVTLPDTWLKKIDGSDSFKVSARLTQNM